MRLVYTIVFLMGFAAIVAEHLNSPSSGRPVSPEDFAGACAPCGAPCPSVQKKRPVSFRGPLDPIDS